MLCKTLLPMLVVFLIPLAQATSIGTVIMSRGDAIAVGENGTERELARRSEVMLGDQLSTGPDSRLQVRMVDDALLDLRSNTDIVLEVYQDDLDDEESRVLMELVGGTLSTLTGRFGDSDEEAYQLRTSNASIGIRGTGYAALYEEGSNTTYTSINSGAINLGTAGGSLPLGTDEAFRHGQAQDNQPPEGLLTPPPQLRQALLDEQLVREDDDEDEGQEGGDASENGATGTAATGPVTDSPDENILADLVRDLELQTEEPDQTTEVIVPDAIADAATESQLFLTAASSVTGSQFGLFAFTEEDGTYALLYPDYPDLSEGYVDAFQVIRFDADPSELTLVCGDESLDDPGAGFLCGTAADTEGWFWGYWDSGLEVAVRDQYEELDQLWIMQVPADTSIEGFNTNLSFNTSFGALHGTNQDSEELSGSYTMELTQQGQLTEAALFLNNDVQTWDLSYEDTANGPFIDAGTLTLDELAGTLTSLQDIGGSQGTSQEFDASGVVKGVFQEDELYYFLGTFAVDAEDSGGQSAQGIVVAPGEAP